MKLLTRERGNHSRVTPYLHSALLFWAVQMPPFSYVTSEQRSLTAEVGTGCICEGLRWDMSMEGRRRAWERSDFSNQQNQNFKFQTRSYSGLRFLRTLDNLHTWSSSIHGSELRNREREGEPGCWGCNIITCLCGLLKLWGAQALDTNSLKTGKKAKAQKYKATNDIAQGHGSIAWWSKMVEISSKIPSGLKTSVMFFALLFVASDVNKAKESWWISDFFSAIQNVFSLD
jgi:hypothetical protein